MAEGIMIPAQAIAEELACPVCFDVYNAPVFLPCGHRGCHNCITECISRHRKCPVCNAAMEPSNVHSDPTTLALVERFASLTAKAEHSYCLQLVRGSAGVARRIPHPHHQHSHTGDAAHGAHAAMDGEGAVANTPSDDLTPLEAVLTRHLSQCIREFQHCWDQLGHQGRHHSQSANNDQGPADSAGALHNDARVGVADARQQLIATLDTYLAQHLPSPNLLPVVVSVHLPARAMVLQGLTVKPGTTGREVKEWLLERLRSDHGMEAKGYTAETKLVLHGPGTAVEEGGGEGVAIEDDTMMQLSVRVLPGASIHVDGNIIVVSEQPPACLRYTFNKAAPTPQDFWTCTTCDLNWVCAGCRRACHVGHDLKPYLQQHTPSWGCCYCRKKGACQLKAHMPEAMACE
eukprot:m.8353 g.8353  ORF g.8353 m.8353 type:complete len:403 (+) comp2527_c0_seq1:58-1266(+)